MEDHTSSGSDSSQYRIRIDGILDSRWSAWFDGMQLLREADQTVLLTGRVDQATLYGIIAKLRNLGLVLVSVSRDP